MRLRKGLSSWVDVDRKETSSPPCVCRSRRQQDCSSGQRPLSLLEVTIGLMLQFPGPRDPAQGRTPRRPGVLRRGAVGELGRPEHKPRLKGPRRLGWGGSLATSPLLPDKTQMWIFTGTLPVWQLIQVGRIVKPSETICPRSSAPWPRGQGLLLATTTDLGWPRASRASLPPRRLHPEHRAGSGVLRPRPRAGLHQGLTWAALPEARVRQWGRRKLMTGVCPASGSRRRGCGDLETEWSTGGLPTERPPSAGQSCLRALRPSVSQDRKAAGVAITPGHGSSLRANTPEFGACRRPRPILPRRPPSTVRRNTGRPRLL